MLQYSSLINLNAFAESNVLTPILIGVFVLKVLAIGAIVPLVKLHWAKILFECYNHKNEKS